MEEQWFAFISQLAATVLGGALVIVANHLTHRRERRLDEERQGERNAALFTAVFSVRNLIVEAMNELAESNDLRLAAGSFKTGLSNINSIIEKSPPDTQYVMSAVYGISLALGELVALTDTPGFNAEQLGRRLARLEEAVEFFDLVAHEDLTIMSDEEVARFADRAESDLDADETPEEVRTPRAEP